jgi:hypothetical protein
MKSLLSRSRFLKTVLVMFVTISFLNVAARHDINLRGGVDTYAIYLNDKLLVRQSLADPIDLKSLPLTAANINDKLVIHYMQCNAPSKVGKNRVITIRDADGRVVKEWRFKDADDSGSSMIIPVKDVLQLQQQAHGTLSFFYSADGLPKTQKLASVQAVKKSNT